MKKRICGFLMVLVLLVANLPVYGFATSSWERAENGMLLSGTTLVRAKADAEVYIIPEGITAIGEAAFYGMDCLTQVTIPSTVTSIGEAAFSGTNLQSLTLCGERIEIGGDAFADSKLTELYITADTVQLGEYAFSGCDRLSNVVIDSKHIVLEKGCFSRCASLTDMVIPEGVTAIPDYAFYGCSNLQSVAIPASVTSIGEAALRGCAALTDIDLATDNPVFTVDESGVLMDGAVLLYAPADLEGYLIPEGITAVGDYAFNECRNLASVTFPVSVDTIGSYAFYGCRRAPDLYFNGSAEQSGSIQLGDYVFHGSVAVHFSAHNGVISGNLSDTVFWSFDRNEDTLTISGSGEVPALTVGDAPAWERYLPEIKRLVIEDGITAIGAYSFCGCTELQQIYIPVSVASIAPDAFYDCHIQEVWFGGSEAQWAEVEITIDGEEAFDGAQFRYDCSRETAFEEPEVSPSPTPAGGRKPWPIVWPLRPTPTPTPTVKPEVTPTVKPEVTPTVKPEVTPTVKPEVTPTVKPEVTPTVKPEVTPTVKPEVTPTVKPEVTPTVKPEVTPTEKPEVTPTVKPEVTPTVKPEVTPTVKPEVTPTVKPEVTPTVKPEVTPEVTPEEPPEVPPENDQGDSDKDEGGKPSTDAELPKKWTFENLFEMYLEMNKNG